MAEKKRSDRKKIAVIEAYGSAMSFLHKRDFQGAEGAFEKFVLDFPSDTDMVDRATQYIKICRRELSPKRVRKTSPEAYFYNGIFKLNDGDIDEAIGCFSQAEELEPEVDKHHFMLAAAFALKGETRRACEHIKKAIKLDERFRIQASNSPDFDSIRDEEEFIKLMAPPTTKSTTS